MQQLLKTAIMIVLVLSAGAVLRTIDVVARTNLWQWTLGELVYLGMFTAAALLVANLPQQMRTVRQSPVKEPALRSLTNLIAIALITVFMYVAIRGVLVEALMGALSTVFAVMMVTLVAYTIWYLYNNFEALTEFARIAVGRSPLAETASATPANPALPASTQPSPDAAAASTPTTCSNCGATNPTAQRFCGSCGNAVA